MFHYLLLYLRVIDLRQVVVRGSDTVTNFLLDLEFAATLIQVPFSWCPGCRVRCRETAAGGDSSCERQSSFFSRASILNLNASAPKHS